MIHFKSAISAMSVFFLLTAPASAQTEVRVDAPPGNRLSWLTRPYQTRSVPPAVLANTARLESLIRSGILYLTAEDVVALAIENNIDVEVQRYAPLLAQEVLRRAQSGGALRSVGLAVAQGPQSVSLQGVSLSSVGAGIAAGNGVSSGGGIVTQLGPAIQSFDPSLLLFTNFQHSTIPQSNTFLTGTTALIQNSRTYQAQYVQNWDFGFTAQATYTSQYTKVNSQLFSLNPYTFGSMDLQLTQNLLQGFGRAVNGRNIRVQRNNVKISNLQFKQQVIATVAAALNLYWDLVSFDEDVRSRKQELVTAQQLLADNKRQVDIGALAPIEVTRAEAQLYTGQQDLVIAQTNLLQQETVLKNALSRNGIASANLTDVHIIPLDRIRVPEQDEIRPMEQLVEAAISNRVEIDQARINLESNQMNLVGIKNSLKPTLQAFAELTNNGLTGDLTAVGAMLGAQYLAGGYGNLLGQIARRNYPNYSVGFSLNIPLRNRAAQSDYVTSLLEIRQNELNLQKSMSQVRVDVQNGVIGLQQARARYDAAVKSRVLTEQTLSADQKKNSLGASTVFQVVQDQRDLANAQSSEVQAMANYTHARIAFDQAIGATLDVNHVSLSEALNGHISRASVLPASLPEDQKQ
ncbi:MAG TPA: TolC family protein [Bryobacteraceae bacterium]|nr:TolC family protein [Bryobacteraceae bacterium]